MWRLVIGLGFWWGIVIIAEVLGEWGKAEFTDWLSGNSAFINNLSNFVENHHQAFFTAISEQH